MGSGVVILECGVFACEGVLIGHAVVAAELLKLAVAAAYAGEAFLPVGGENQLKGVPAALSDLLGVGEHFHALVDGEHASRDERTGSLDLDHADTAGADLVHILEVAEGGNLDARISRRFKDRNALGYAQGHIIYLYVYHFH